MPTHCKTINDSLIMVTLTLIDSQTQQPLQQWQFSQQTVIRIGRHKSNDLVFSDCLSVSRYHLELQKVDPDAATSSWRLVSHGVNGTFLNGVHVCEALLKEHDQIRLTSQGPLLTFEHKTLASVLPPTIPPCDHQGNQKDNLFCIHCGQPIVEQEQYIRGYQILRTLGQGGMGTTYLAWDKRHEPLYPPQLAVIKEMNANIAKIPKAQELFAREARILQSLNHPGIPRYHDYLVEDGKKYLVMELIHGQNLEYYVYHNGCVPLEQALNWMMQTCEILVYLHSLTPPLVHRDIKPANLMLGSRDRQIMLIDFGAVKEIGTPLGTRIGVEGYTAPEQNRGKPCPQSDLYAIGPTLIYLLTGHSPLQYYHSRHGELFLDVNSIPELPSVVVPIIDQACQVQLRDRYSCAQELLQALTTCWETIRADTDNNPV